MDDERRRMAHGARAQSNRGKAQSNSMRPLPRFNNNQFQVTADWVGILMLAVAPSTNIDSPLQWKLYMKGVPPHVHFPCGDPAKVTGASGEVIEEKMTSKQLFHKYFDPLRLLFVAANQESPIEGLQVSYWMLNRERKFEWVKENNCDSKEYMQTPVGYLIEWDANQTPPSSPTKSEGTSLFTTPVPPAKREGTLLFTTPSSSAESEGIPLGTPQKTPGDSNDDGTSIGPRHRTVPMARL